MEYRSEQPSNQGRLAVYHERRTYQTETLISETL